MITQKELKEFLKYTPETGLFVWIKVNPRSRRAKVGDIAGCLGCVVGYTVIVINTEGYYAHRLAWLYVYGEWPKHQIDHINHIRDDNRIANLREATHQENSKNRTIQSNNTSGHAGIHLHKPSMKWIARIKVNGKRIYLGSFEKKKDAIARRQTAEILHEYHPNHGRAEF